MRQLTDQIRIDAEPEKVWDWLTHLAEHYQEWHPEHVSASWEEASPNRPGSTLRAVENLEGKREVLRFELTSIEAPQSFEYRLRGPISLLMPRGAFTITGSEGGSTFTARLFYRF